jgi:crotonobetainyl-CoA:carnitine CoA-transferase CaiB-like acyl-CoA transferase
MNTQSPSAPLAGIRVIDITEVVMGPLATQMLAELGADVIKIEPPGGDMLRGTGPGGRNLAGPLFLNLNRNKRSLVLDLKTTAGKEAILKLIATADVVVYNIRPAAMTRLGLGYEELSKLNPRLIYVGTFGFSQRGRYADARAFDDMIQSAVAIPQASMMAGSEVGRYAPLNLADRATGLYAFGVINAALFARERTGKGQSVDVPMFETMANLVLGDHLYGHTFVPSRAGFGYPRVLNPQRRPFQTLDGLVCCLVYTSQQWSDFMSATGEEEMFRADPRFADGESRTLHAEDLYRFVSEKLQTRTSQEWKDLLEPLGIPVFAAHTFETLLADPHLEDIGFFNEYEHPTEGTLRTMSVPSEWSDSRLPALAPPPLLGEHCDQVLAEAGYTRQQIDELVADGVTHRAQHDAS